MRTTLNLDDNLIREATRLTGLRAKAVRRQASAPGALRRPRPLERLESALEDRRREGGGRDPGAGDAVGDAAGGAHQAGGPFEDPDPDPELSTNVDHYPDGAPRRTRRRR